MRIAVHHLPDMNPDNYAWKWVEELERKGVEVVKLDFRTTDIIARLKGCDGAMWHWYHIPHDKFAAPKILQAIELGLGIPVFPNIKTSWHFDEKASQHFLLEAINAPKIPSWVFQEEQQAREFVSSAKFPLVFKLSPGAGSANVFMLNTKEEADEIISIMFSSGLLPYTGKGFEAKPLTSFRQRLVPGGKYILMGQKPNETTAEHWHYLLQKDYVYFQKFVTGNDYDIRITVIGDRAFGFIRYNRDNDFRASGSGKIDYDVSKIPVEAIKTAHEVSAKCGFQSMAYDFLRNENGEVLINEISYAYVNKAVYACNGYWDRDMNFHEGQIWPEAAQVEDFINLVKSQG